MDREELLDLYAGGEKDFTGKSFCNSHWNDETIRDGIYTKTDFSGAYCDCVSFMEADFSFADFRQVRMYETSFENCFMEGVNFSSATFGQVLFYNVDLTRAIFRDAIFTEAGFSNADLSYADLSGAKNLIIESCDRVILYETIMPDGSIRTAKT